MNSFIPTHPVSLQEFIFSFPPEVICRIFLASLTESPFKKFQHDEHGDVSMTWPASSMTTPFTLAAVCRSWRNIVLNAPELWSSVYLVAVPYKAARQAHLLRYWLDRSKDVPLTIEIDCSSDEEKQWHATHHREASTLLCPVFNHNSRCTAFRTRLPPDCLLLPSRDSKIPDPAFSNLTTLSVVPRDLPFEDEDEEVYRIDLFQHAGRLRRVEIHEVAFKQLTISWLNVVKVTTTVVSLKDCIRILRAAPKLEECIFNNIAHFGERGYNLQPIILPRLSTLTLDFREMNVFDDHITRILTAPNLKKLGYIHMHGDVFPTGDFVAFMQRSLCHLTDLSIRNSFMSAEALRRVLLLDQVAPSLEGLYIQLSPPHDIQAQLEAPNPTYHDLSQVFYNRRSIILPRLSTLTLDFREMNVFNDHITRILTAPNLKKLEYIHMHGDEFPADDFTALMQRSLCHLTDLSIRNSFMSAETLRFVLFLDQVAPSLEGLHIQLSPSPDIQAPLEAPNPAYHILSPVFPRIQSWFFSGPLTTMCPFFNPSSPSS